MFTKKHFATLKKEYPGQMNLPDDPYGLYHITLWDVVRLLHAALEDGKTLQDISTKSGVSVPTLSRMSSKPHWRPTVRSMEKVYFALIYEYGDDEYQYPMPL